MSKHMIQPRDIVLVQNHSIGFTLLERAEVVHIPQGPGDSWGFRSIADDRIVYTSEPCTITLLSKDPKNLPQS